MPNRIRKVTYIPVVVPVPVERVNCPPFREALNALKSGKYAGMYFGDMPFYIVKVEGDGGIVGWCDTTRGLDPQRMIGFARRLIGLRDDEIDPRRPMIVDHPKEGGLPSSHDPEQDKRDPQPPYHYAGIESAVLDWAARSRGVPMWKLFGQKVRDAVKIDYWSGFRTPEGAEKVAREALEGGFKGLKLKAGPAVDVEGITQAVVKVCGPDYHFVIDPNGKWPDLEMILQRARAAQALSNAVVFEDPVYSRYDWLAEVRKQTGITIAVTTHQPDNVRRAVAMAATDLFNLGGLWSQFLQAADAAREVNKPFWIGSAVPAGLGDLASIHAACTQPNCTLGSDLVAHWARTDDLLLAPIQHRDGGAVVPDGPGLGIDADQDAIERHRVGDPIVVQ